MIQLINRLILFRKYINRSNDDFGVAADEQSGAGG